MRWRGVWFAFACVAGCTGVLDIDGFDYAEPAAVTTGGAGGAPGSGGSPGAGGMTTSQGGTSSGGEGGAGAAGQGGGGGASSVWFDDFSRADDPGIGNGWVEKTTGAFGLVNDEIVALGGSNYRNNLVYRPQAEALRDVEASVEFEITGTNGYPQMFIRVQYATIATQGEYDGYNLWFPGSTTTVNLARQIGTASSTTLEQIVVSPPLAVGNRYRMRMTADGDDPVQLAGYIEQWDGADWNVIGSATYEDGDAQRFDTAGAVGFAGNGSTVFTYDNFTYRPL